MAFVLKNVFSAFTNAFRTSIASVPTVCNGASVSVCNGASLSALLVPVRTKYIDNRMIRDVKRRKVVKEYAKLRAQINSIRRNTILPKQLRAVADKEIAALPTDSCVTKLHARCVLTSRARGRYRKFRMSRIIWRHLADYNQISGVERAMWGWS